MRRAKRPEVATAPERERGDRDRERARAGIRRGQWVAPRSWPFVVWATGWLALTALAGGALGDVIQVDTLSDLEAADGECSLREAIVAANDDAAYLDCPAGGGFVDEIELTVPGTITLGSLLPEITGGTVLRGLGIDHSIIVGSTSGILECDGGDSELLRLEDLRFTGGSASEGGALRAGGGRLVEIVRSQFDDNHATSRGGAISIPNLYQLYIQETAFLGNTSGGIGGAIATTNGILEISDSTFSGNEATGNGGAVSSSSNFQLAVVRSTFHDNRSASSGGAISAGSVIADFVLRSSTLTGNVADSDADGIGDGGALALLGSEPLALTNSVIAGNDDLGLTGTVCRNLAIASPGSIESEGFNWISDHACVESEFPLGFPNIGNDFVGSGAAPLDPQLGPLAQNGGATETRLPLAASPVIDQGSCPLDDADQRGFTGGGTRVVDIATAPDLDDGCDIGSTEFGATGPPVPETPLFADDFESGTTEAWSSVSP
ncbi:MAG: CSLREA domain-containing protein [Acidobacteria bacterium]|nr:MAG: CSLREA domain-containing protein [Acidobacteriota bacterium]REK09515.1 MAG: CSLREA domain-containing protein [Acidobacteriota bacterium]